MSYSYLLITSQEIVLFSITYIALSLQLIRYRLIPHCGVYYDYDNSSVLLSNNFCTLPSIDFYIFSTHITAYRKQPYKSILLSDYLLDNSKPHDLAVQHLGNNIFNWQVVCDSNTGLSVCKTDTLPAELTTYNTCKGYPHLYPRCPHCTPFYISPNVLFSTPIY